MLTALIVTFIYITFFKSRHIKVVKATAKTFVRDAVNAHGNINYRIEFIVKKSSHDMKIDELWIDRKLYKFRISRSESAEQVENFNEKENLQLEAIEIAEDQYATPNPPNYFNGAALIGYRINNRKRYLPVNKIEFV